jgi:predicted RecB family nuclease
MTKLLSASRLNAFQACRHQTALWLQGVKPPERADDAVTLIRAKGFEHEAVVVERLRAQYGKVVEIPQSGSLDESVAATKAAMQAGAPVIYQAALTDGRWIGYPDFLVRVADRPDGHPAYEPEDAKLARKAKAEHLLQLGVYAELLEGATGQRPMFGAIHGGGRANPERFRLEDTRHITRRMMRQFDTFIGEPEATTPVKNGACGQCDFSERCTAEWRAADSPVFVAGIRADQIIKLAAAGVRTLSDLAVLDTDQTVKGIGAPTLAKLVAQSRLQKSAATCGSHFAEVLPSLPMRGFAIMPAPQAGDLFYDIEGDPLYPEGLEYLHGLWGPVDDPSTDAFKAFWAHDHSAEKTAFEDLMDFFQAHLARYPDARIYHYAPYETTALKRLAMKYATREAALDQMLREKRFIDLYAVVRHAIQASTESYSLKDLEKIYWGGRAGEVTNASDSIVEYERYRELGDHAILDAIERYNEDDVVSTARLRDWLEDLRPDDVPFALEVERDDETPVSAKAEQRAQFAQDRLAAARALRAQGALEPELRELLAELLWFHQRSQKPQWWALFDRQTWTDEELIEDPESLGGLTLMGVGSEKRSLLATYAFPPQDTKLKEGDRPRFALTLEPAGSLVELNTEDGRAVLKRAANKGDHPAEASLSPGQLIDQGVMERALLEMARRLAGGDFETDKAVLDMLRRNAPDLSGRSRGEAVVAQGGDLVAETRRAVADLDRSCLIVQGPPGTGKTYTTARAIAALLRDGKRVAVSSNSHKAINNLLIGLSKYCQGEGQPLRGVKKGTVGQPETACDAHGIITVGASEDVTPDFALVGATVFELAKHPANSFDYLFVDEAGQVSLGNLLAMAGAAKNLILVGDQMQLPQPVQGVHPGETGLSAMDFAMQDHPTVPPDRGVLLNVSWRMHPDVCGFISAAVYEGRLTSEPSTARQRLVLEGDLHRALQPTGVVTVDLAHEGCTQSSDAEAALIADLISQLLRQSWIDASGEARAMALNDILVVTPFNMQVGLLKKRLPANTRIGTVDKFQGQEAPVVLISMATSFGGDAPRGTEFLFNRNRLNVAISRAQGLAVLVKGSRLLELPTPGLLDLPRLDLVARAEVAAAE